MASKNPPHTRIIRSSPRSSAGLQVGDDKAALIGDRRHFVIVDGQGITLRGPIRVVAMSNDVRKAGLWVGLGEFVEMIPSTIVTPHPAVIPMPPVFLATAAADAAAYFKAAIG